MDPTPIAIPPALASRYRLGPALGKGAFSVVYRATQIELGRPVVLKLLALEADLSPEAKARFQAEARILARMRHAHVQALLEHGLEAEAAYLVYPDEGGVSLKDWVAGRPIKAVPLAAAERILDEVLQGLEYLHGKGVIHRDLKPANLLVTQDGGIRIFDFGLSRDLMSKERLTRTDTILGTPGYMAPDQIKGGDPDPRDDLYAFGVVAYELLTGTNPFMAESLGDVFRRQLSHTPEPLRASQAGIPEELSLLIADCLAKPRRDRPASAREALERLRGASPEAAKELAAKPRLDRSGATARDPGTSSARQRSLEARGRSRHGWLVAGCVVVGVVAGAFIARGPGSRDPSLPTRPAGPAGPCPAWADEPYAQHFEDRLAALTGEDFDRLGDPLSWPRLLRHLDEDERFRSWLRLGGPTTDPADPTTRERLLRLDRGLRKHGLPELFGPWLLPCPGLPPEPSEVYGSVASLVAPLKGIPVEGLLRAGLDNSLRSRGLRRAMAQSLAGDGDFPRIPPELMAKLGGPARSLAVVSRGGVLVPGDLGELAFQAGPRERRIFARWAAPIVDLTREMTIWVARSIRLEPATAGLAALLYEGWLGLSSEGCYGAWIHEDPDVQALGAARTPGDCLFRATLLQTRARLPGQTPEEYARLKEQEAVMLALGLAEPPAEGPVGEALRGRLLLQLLEVRIYSFTPEELLALVEQKILPHAARCPQLAEVFFQRLLVLEERLIGSIRIFAPTAKAALAAADRPGGILLTKPTREGLARLIQAGP